MNYKFNRYLVSSCLVGNKCSYKGTDNKVDKVAQLNANGFCYPICPEVAGGLSIPRNPCEIVKDKVINNKGEDKTLNYQKGAELALSICKQNCIYTAILKAKSPSCGRDFVYDGTFSNKLIKGKGVTAGLLSKNGIEVFDENDGNVYDAIILAAGSAVRSHQDINKVLITKKDTSVIKDAVLPFISDYLCNKVIVVYKKGELESLKKLLPFDGIEYVEGGSCREESVKKGLEKVESKYVFIHDGARPNINTKLVYTIVLTLHTSDAVCPYTMDSINKLDYNFNGLYIQTPQAYKTDILRDRINSINDLSQYRDESSMLKDIENITYIEGYEENYKITTKEDIDRYLEEE